MMLFMDLFDNLNRAHPRRKCFTMRRFWWRNFVDFFETSTESVCPPQCDQIGQFIWLWATFKAFGNNYFVQIFHILRQFFKGFKIYHFSSEIIFGNFYRHLVIFFWSHWSSAYFLDVDIQARALFYWLREETSEGRGFESRRRILGGHNIFSHYIVVRIEMFVWKDENKRKRELRWPIF